MSEELISRLLNEIREDYHANRIGAATYHDFVERILRIQADYLVRMKHGQGEGE